MGRLFNTAIFLAASAISSNAQSEDALFKAMAILASGSGMEDVLPPKIVDGNYVDLIETTIGGTANVLSAGPGGCSIIQTTVSQERRAFAQISVATFDFAKLTGARYLGPNDDFAAAASRELDDPQVDSIALDGKSWHCQRIVGFQSSKPEFSQFCDDGWLVSLVGEADKLAAVEAIKLIRDQCTPK